MVRFTCFFFLFCKRDGSFSRRWGFCQLVFPQLFLIKLKVNVEMVFGSFFTFLIRFMSTLSRNTSVDAPLSFEGTRESYTRSLGFLLLFPSSYRIPSPGKQGKEMNQPALDRTLKRPLDRLRILGSMGLRLRKVRKWQKVLLKATFLSFLY